MVCGAWGADLHAVKVTAGGGNLEHAVLGVCCCLYIHALISLVQLLHLLHNVRYPRLIR